MQEPKKPGHSCRIQINEPPEKPGRFTFQGGKMLTLSRKTEYLQKLILFFVPLSLFLPVRLPKTGHIMLIYLVIVASIFVFLEMKFNSVATFLFFTIPFTRVISYFFETTAWGMSSIKEVLVYLVLGGYIALLNCLLAIRLFGKEPLFHKIIKCFIFCGLVLSIISIQQTYNLFGMNGIYLPWLNPETDVQIQRIAALVANHAARPIGFIGNPNEFGFQIGLCLLSSWYAFLYYKRKYLYFFICVFIFLGLFFTASRSSFVFVGAGAFLMLLGSDMHTKRKKMGILIGLLSLSAVFLVIGLNIPQFAPYTGRILGLFNMSEDLSWQLRLSKMWNFNLSWFTKSPFFGVGTLQVLEPEAADNEWLLLLRQWGVLGTVVLVFVIVAPLVGVWLRRRIPSRNLFFSLGLLVGAGLYMIPTGFISSLPLYTAWAMLYFSALWNAEMIKLPKLL